MVKETGQGTSEFIVVLAVLTLIGIGIMSLMTDRGGIRAEILLDGEIAIGDVIDLSSIVP